MGTFTAKLRVWNPAHPERVEELEPIVDTGAAFSWIARARLQRLEVTPSRRMQFQTIEGRVLEWELAIVYVATDGYTAPDLVVMAEAGEMELIGAHSIEGLGLAADPVQKKLIPTVMLALRATSANS
jgi:aspartyl protease family protein